MNAMAPITAAPASQLDKLDTLIAKLTAARGVATTGRFFDSIEGQIAINAAHDLFEVDGLYDLALDVLVSATPEHREDDLLDSTVRTLFGRGSLPTEAWDFARMEDTFSAPLNQITGRV